MLPGYFALGYRAGNHKAYILEIRTYSHNMNFIRTFYAEVILCMPARSCDFCIEHGTTLSLCV